jgi:hypothetical protein
MAQFDTPYTAAPEEPQPQRRKWPLASVMAIDCLQFAPRSRG